MTREESLNPNADEDPLHSSQLFYARRDNRTNLLTENDHYQNAQLLVSADDATSKTIAGQTMILTALNALSRFNRNIDIAICNASLVPLLQHSGQPAELCTQARKEMEDGDPHGTFRFVDDPTDQYDCALAIGNVTVPTTPVIRITACGWGVRVQRNASITEFEENSSNPLGPAAAACLGVGEVFKTLIERPARQCPERYSFDVFTLTPNPEDLTTTTPSLPDEVNVGTIELAGVGSIGSAFLYFVRTLPMRGQFVLIDPDIVEFENLNRSPVFTAEDAAARHSKVAVGDRFLENEIEVNTFAEKYGASREQDAIHPDLVLPEVDDDRARGDIQYSRPPLMVGATTDQSAMDIRRQIPITEPCLLCHFPPGETTYTPICATASNDALNESNGAETSDPDAALPFVSYLAGVLLAAEVVKTQYDSYPITENYVSIEMFSDFEVQDRYTKHRDEECPFCSYSNEVFYRGCIEDSRFYF